MADYCVLSVEETARLEVFGSWPICKEHRHIKQQDAMQLVNEETHRLVGGVNTKVQLPVTMIVPVALRGWAVVPACNNDGSRLMGFRTWGLPQTT